LSVKIIVSSEGCTYEANGKQLGPYPLKDHENPNFDRDIALQLGVEPKEVIEARLREIQRPTNIDEIVKILGETVKHDIPTKAITFLAMLTAFTDEDQVNIAFQAESSTGKSYIPIELSYFFKHEKDLIIIASASPTAFYHESGIFDKENRRIIVDLERKILIFLDQPHFLLLEKLRPLLSHDTKELIYKITDKRDKWGLRTKNVVIKGYPVVIFCSAKSTSDEQEKTRFLFLSPETSTDKIRDSLKLLAKRLGDREKFKVELESNPLRYWLKQRVGALRDAGIRNVVIPNPDEVCDRFLKAHPYLAPRHQRDFPRLISLIKGHALLNWACRDRTNTNSIIATKEDEDEAFKIYDKVAKSNEIGLSPEFYEIFLNVIQLLINNGNEASREMILAKYFDVNHRHLSDTKLRREIIPQLRTVGLVAERANPLDKREMLVYSPVQPNSYPPIPSPISPNGNNRGEHRG